MSLILPKRLYGVTPEDVVYHGLKGGRAVGHAKEHYQRFEQASIGLEGCLPLISRLNADVVEMSRTEFGGTEVKDNREKLHSVPE